MLRDVLRIDAQRVVAAVRDVGDGKDRGEVALLIGHAEGRTDRRWVSALVHKCAVRARVGWRVNARALVAAQAAGQRRLVLPICKVMLFG